MNCIICNSQNVNTVKIISKDDSEIELIRCKKCGHLWQSIDNYKDIYSDGKFSNITRSGNMPSTEKINQLDEMAFSRFNFYKNYLNEMNDLLEVGSSVGSFVNLLKILGKSATGLEPDPDYSLYSEKQYGFNQITCLLEDYEAKNKYDGVISFYVIENIKNPHTFLKSVFDLLEINGKVLFECPSLDTHSYGNINRFIWKSYIHCFSITSIYYLFSFYFDVLSIGIRQNSLYVYAEKNKNRPNFNPFTFAKLKIISKLIYSFNSMKLVPPKNKKLVHQFFSEPYISVKKGISLIGKTINYSLYLRTERKSKNNILVSHVSVHILGNVGDTVLSKCVRDTFNRTQSSLRWNLHYVRSPVDENLINDINKSKFLLIGGGGLFLPDTNKNSISGWQWACSKENLNNIDKKIVVFAVGYNYFRGQEPEDLFIENLKELVSKSSFFGLRNNGSCRKVRELVGNNLGRKIVFQPCPTTLIRKLYELPDKQKTKNIAFNIAFDRYKQRYGLNMYEILDQISLAAKKLSDKGYKIFNVAHVSKDLIFDLSLEKHSVPHETIKLGGELPNKVFDFYNRMDVVIGMRGHAQMIPFGINCGIITLGSHDKMKWFLEDIDFLDLYIDIINIKPENLCHEILEKFEHYYGENNYDRTLKIIKTKQEFLYNITLKNMSDIKMMINS